MRFPVGVHLGTGSGRLLLGREDWVLLADPVVVVVKWHVEGGLGNAQPIGEFERIASVRHLLALAQALEAGERQVGILRQFFERHARSGERHGDQLAAASKGRMILCELLTFGFVVLADEELARNAAGAGGHVEKQSVLLHHEPVGMPHVVSDQGSGLRRSAGRFVVIGVESQKLQRDRTLCNIIVVAGGVWQYGRAGDLKVSFALPFVALSIPMAWFGGTMPIERTTFVMFLGLSLLAAGIAMWFQPPKASAAPPGSPAVNWFVGLPVGGAIGFLSGMVGIGGGIFLAPCLHLLRLADPKRIAATSSLFILVNSIAGLVGQTMKHRTTAHLDELASYGWLFAAVLVGGQIGSRLSTRALSGTVVKRLTAVLVFYVAVRLLIMSFG